MSVQCLIFTDYEFNLISRPAGPYRIATELRHNGFTAQVLHFALRWSDEQLKAGLEKYVGDDTLFVGISTTFINPDKPWIMKISAMAKAINPKIKIVVGGYHSIYQQNQLVDYFVMGLADYATVELAKHLQDPTHPIKKKPTLKGDDRWIIDSNDYSVDIFDHPIEFSENDFIRRHEPLPIETARGCIFKCSFCAYPLNGKKRNDYVRDFNSVHDEMLRNYEMFGTTNYIFADDTINDSPDKIDGLHKAITSLPFDIKFTGYLRLDVMYRHQEMATKLLEMGMESAFFGIETLHPETARKIGKGGVNIRDAMYWVRDVWGDRVTTMGSFMVGLPSEPLTSVLDTVEWTRSDDYPLDTVSWSALSVFSHQNATIPKPYMSRMELEPEKFGIDADVVQWISRDGILTLQSAKQLVKNWNGESYDWPMAGLDYRSRLNIIIPGADTIKLSPRQMEKMGYSKKAKAARDKYIRGVLS